MTTDDKVISMAEFESTDGSDSPNKALESALRNAGEMKEVLAVGFDKEGGFFIYSSQMTCRDAGWILDTAKEYVRE